jgi:hypothetical protein
LWASLTKLRLVLAFTSRELVVRQLIDEPKLVYEVGFIREKGKAIVRAVQQSPEIGSSLLR